MVTKNKKLTIKQKYDGYYTHIYLQHLPQDTIVTFKKDILFDNFDEKYLNNLLNNYNVKKILDLTSGQRNIKRIEITIQIFYCTKDKDNKDVLNQIRKYPTSSELHNLEFLFKKFKMSEGIYNQYPNFNWEEFLGNKIGLSFICIDIEHNNANLYKLL